MMNRAQIYEFYKKVKNRGNKIHFTVLKFGGKLVA